MIRGNAAILKCLIPSFVADFVEVVSWHTDQDESYYPGTDYGWLINKHGFSNNINNKIRNASIQIPGNKNTKTKLSIKSNFDRKSNIHFRIKSITHVSRAQHYQSQLDFKILYFLSLTFSLFYHLTVISQFYDTDVNKAYVIRGNAAILKCEIPSFVADFVSVVSWHTDQDEVFYPGTNYGLCDIQDLVGRFIFVD